MKLGFSGTRDGLSPIQTFVMHGWLQRELREGDEFHHGDCIGADQSAHNFVAELKPGRPGLTIIGHPPINERARAFTNCDALWLPKDYLDRNHDIVNSTETLLVTPGTEHEIVRSGTWSTLRYARKNRRPIAIIYPSGRLEEEVPAI